MATVGVKVVYASDFVRTSCHNDTLVLISVDIVFASIQ